MAKQKILLLIPMTIVAGLLIYSWAIILLTDIKATWRHYLAFGLFVVLIFLYIKSFAKSVLVTGFYFVVGTCNLLTLTPSVTTSSYGIRVGSTEMWTPSFQLLSFGLLILYFILNFDTLTNIYLDYKDTRQAKNKNS